MTQFYEVMKQESITDTIEALERAVGDGRLVVAGLDPVARVPVSTHLTVYGAGRFVLTGHNYAGRFNFSGSN